MDKVELEKTLRDTFGSVILNVQEPDGIITITITSDSVIPFIQFVKDNLSYNFLTDICGTHFPENELP
jgi:NADH-quinone oxidoreductase subunit C